MSDAFEALFAAAAPGMLSALGGQTIALTPQGGSPKNIQVIVRSETRDPVTTNEASLDHEVMQAEIAATFDDGSAYTCKEFGKDGNSGDSLLINGKTWYVAEILNGRAAFGGMYSVMLKDQQIPDASDLN